MKRTEWLQETLKMRFEDAYVGWQGNRLTQEEAAQILGVSDRTFRRYVGRYEDSELEGLGNKRNKRRNKRDRFIFAANAFGLAQRQHQSSAIFIHTQFHCDNCLQLRQTRLDRLPDKVGINSERSLTGNGPL